MATRGQKVRVGLFVVVAGVLLAIVLVMFGGLRFWKERDRYHILFDGSVIGLEEGAVVYLNGVKVGNVERIGVAPQDVHKVNVTIALEKGTPVHTDTRAMLVYAGITGLKEIDLRHGTDKTPLVRPGSTIPQGDTLLDRVSDDLEVLIKKSIGLTERANRVLAQFEHVEDIVASVRTTAKTLEHTAGSLRSVVGESRKTLRSSLLAVERTAKSAHTLIDEHVNQLVSNADSLVTDVRGVVHRNDSAIRDAVSDLRQASRSFKELVREVRQRPSRLLFSQPARERKLP